MSKKVSNTLKVLTMLIVLFYTTIETLAQPLQFEQQSIGIGIGIPAINDYNYTSRNPSITAHYEYGISDKIGIGYISFGGLISFAGAEYKANIQSFSVTYDYNHTLIGPRGVYHFDMVELTNNNNWSNIDVYGGAFLGLKFEKIKYENPINDRSEKNNNTELATDLFAGIRYGFTDNIGAFAELGFGVNYFNIGVSWRL